MAIGTYEAQYSHGVQVMVDYTPGAAVAAGEVVVNNDLVGVALQAIAKNALGAICVSGIFTVAKKSTDTFQVGTKVYWDDSNNYATTTSTNNTYLGKAVEAAGSGVTEAKVLLCQQG